MAASAKSLGSPDSTGAGEAGEPARASEALLFALLPELRGTRILACSAGRAQIAVAVASGDPSRQVVAPFFDLHLAQRARESAREPPANLSIEAVAELPEGPFDCALIPLRAGSDSELAWELLQTAFLRLVDGGQLIVSVDEPRDHWVAGRMDVLFRNKVSRRPADDAIAYVGVKRAERKPQRKVKEFESLFAFRDRGRLIQVVSRPGVFSHRRLDLGARALIESLSEPTGRGGEREVVQAGARVLDLGCGAGAVGFAAGLRANGVHVHAVDSMPRAVACSLRGAELNGISGRYTAQAVADGAITGAGFYDLALANPPYYSHHRIAELFVRAAQRSLKPGGRVHIVTRQADWFAERLPADFRDVRVRELRTYAVVTGTRK